MNGESLAWLMELNAPNWPATLEELLRRPAGATRSLCRGDGHREFIIDVKTTVSEAVLGL